MLIVPPQPTGGVNLSGALPLDVVPGVWTTAGGVCALTRTWRFNKPLFDVTAGGTTYTIKSINGYPDVKRLAALGRVSPRVGVVGFPCSKVYDQSGNGNDWTQATSGNRAFIWLVNGKVYLFFGGILATQLAGVPNFFNVTGSYNNRAQSVFALVKPYSTTNATSSSEDTGALFATGTHGSGGGYWWWPISPQGSAPEAGAFDSVSFSSSVQFSPPNWGIQKSVASLILDAASSTIYMNENSASGPAFPVATPTSAQIGISAFSDPGFPGRVQALMVAGGTALNSTQAGLVRQALYNLGNVRVKNGANAKINFVIDGASITQGAGSDPANLYQTQDGGGYGAWEIIQDQLEGYDIQWNNVAQYGDTIANATTRYSKTAGACFNSSAAANFLVGPSECYGNSINGGRTGAQAYSDAVAYWTAAQADAWTNIFAEVWQTAGASADELTYISSVVTNAATNGVTLFDFRNLTDYSGNSAYENPDGHPKVLGNQSLAGAILPYVLPYI